METTATVKLVLDSREKGESRKQLKIRVTFERIPRLYSTETKVLLTKEELENPKLKSHKSAMEKVKRSLSIVNEIVMELGERFTFDEFGREYKQRLYARADDKSLFTVVAERYIESQELQPKTIASHSARTPTCDGGNPGIPISKCIYSTPVRCSTLRTIAPT